LDIQVGKLINALNERKKKFPNENWVTFVTTDHGGTSQNQTPIEMREHWKKTAKSEKSYKDQETCPGIHGFSIPQMSQTFIIINGDNVKPVEIIPSPKSYDVAVSIIDHFDIPIDKSQYEGKTLLIKNNSKL